ncbi:MAG: putative Na+/H+ antiporter [Simkaniaceae bacterium]
MLSTFIAVLLKELKPNLELEAPIFTIFHIISLLIFSLAIIHTLLADKFTKLACKVEERHKKSSNKKNKIFYLEDGTEAKSFWAEILYFLGEVEVIFGIWVIPLLIAIVSFYDWNSAVAYIDSRNYTEPIFVVIIMCVASTRPILDLAERILNRFAKIFGDSVSSWWLSILCIAPLLGSFITEAGAMTLAALLLARKFYEYEPSEKLCYATMGLLFVNISVGGVLTNFAAPPVLVIANYWNWSSWHMLTYFGWKVLLGLAISNSTYYFFFRKELKQINRKKLKAASSLEKENPIPLWIIFVHILMLIWIVATENYPSIFMGSFLLFLGFLQATSPHQYPLNLKKPLLVGFFLAGLVIHGGLQGWWIIPLLGKLQEGALMVAGVVLTAFNDNAAVTYLASLIPDLPGSLKHAILSGVVAGGGLTVIANAPNPAGLSLLKKYFPRGVSFLHLFFAALLPTLIYFMIFYFGLSD